MVSNETKARDDDECPDAQMKDSSADFAMSQKDNGGLEDQLKPSSMSPPSTPTTEQTCLVYTSSDMSYDFNTPVRPAKASSDVLEETHRRSKGDANISSVSQAGFPDTSKTGFYSTHVLGHLENQETPFGMEIPFDGSGEVPYHIRGAVSGEEQGPQLVTAREVTEEGIEKDTVLQEAEAMDPLRSSQKKLRFICVLLFAVLVLSGIIACVVGLTIVPSIHNDEAVSGYSTNVPASSAPTTYRESLGIQVQLEKVFGSSKLNDPATPHYKALQWILYGDPLELSANDPNLIQRYVLALLYFQTSENGPWRSCNRPNGTDGNEQTCEFQTLVGIYPELTFDSAEGNRWLSNVHECEWVGVSCEFDFVADIALYGNKMSSRIPAELGELAELKSLSLSWNELTGTLPLSLARSIGERAFVVELNNNQLTGTIPKEWFQFRSIRRLNLADNFFRGSLATEIGNLGPNSLLGLYLYGNSGLTGTIPSEFFELTSLVYSRLARTKLTGSIASEIGKLTDLQEFWLHKTSISSRIPSDIKNNHKLTDLRLYDTEMSGSIPEELYELTNLGRIDLYNASFSGTISPKIGQLSLLNVLRLQGNNFEGVLPSELSLLTHLQQVRLDHNDLSGTVPEEWCELRTEGALRELSVDCLYSANTSIAFVECPDGCCTQCCDSETHDCVSLVDIGN